MKRRNSELVERPGISRNSASGALSAERRRVDNVLVPSTIVCERAPREPTLMRGFSQPLPKTKKHGKTNRLCRVFGRGDGDRTHDLSVPNAARYQLRYAS